MSICKTAKQGQNNPHQFTATQVNLSSNTTHVMRPTLAPVMTLMHMKCKCSNDII